MYQIECKPTTTIYALRNKKYPYAKRWGENSKTNAPR